MEMSMSDNILMSMFSGILVTGRQGSVSPDSISSFSRYQPPIYLYDELGVFCGKLYLASFLCYTEGTNGGINSSERTGVPETQREDCSEPSENTAAVIK